MARAVVVAVAALVVLCAAVLLAGAHAGRVIGYQALEAGLDVAAPALAPLAAAAASSPASADDVVADAGGVRRDDDDRERISTTAIGDVLWFVLQWANQAAGGGNRRKAY